MPLAAQTGHARIAALLQQAVARKSVPQSLILAGPEGTGKRAMAIALAQAVNCPNPKNGDACGDCHTCARIARGDHYDVVVVEPEDGTATIKIEQLREQVLNAVGYRPFEANKRVFIIDPADAMTDNGQDALLKTLEEPPTSAILMLITSYPDSLARTIQSRCRRLRFEKADTGFAEPPAADFEPAMAFLMAAVERSVPKKLKASATLATVKGDRRVREAVSTRLEIVSALLRDVSAVAADELGAVQHRDAAGELRTLAKSFDQHRIAKAWAALQRAQQALDRNGGPKIVADWTVMSL
jgi:DNA polymerase III delta' subunit